MAITLPIDEAANEYLSRSPLAVVLGLTLDQQIPLEKAFTSPWVLAQRLDHEPTAPELAEFNPDSLAKIFATPPALHRFPKAMAARVQEVCSVIVDRYAGNPAAIWTDAADGSQLLQRILDLPGFGKQKAQIFVAMLGKQCDVQPDGWREAAGHYGEAGSYHSVADIIDQDSLTRVREYKKMVKAEAKAAKE